MAKDYKTVLSNAKDEFVEKRSRFIGYCKPVTCEQEAVDFINEKRSEHWNATHNVYAYSLREGACRVQTGIGVLFVEDGSGRGFHQNGRGRRKTECVRVCRRRGGGRKTSGKQ